MEDQFGRLKKYNELSHRYDGPIPRDKLNELKCGGPDLTRRVRASADLRFWRNYIRSGIAAYRSASTPRRRQIVSTDIRKAWPKYRHALNLSQQARQPKQSPTSQSATRKIAQEFDNNGTVCMGNRRALDSVRAAGNCHSIWSNSPQLRQVGDQLSEFAWQFEQTHALSAAAVNIFSCHPRAASLPDCPSSSIAAIISHAATEERLRNVSSIYFRASPQSFASSA